jgi:uncharacterized protein YjiS (DUF1127 family)
MTTIGSGSSLVYPRRFLPGRSRTVGWSVRRALEDARRLADRGLVTLMDWYDIAQERRSLGSMSDEMLKDIGVSRADAMREAGRRFWDMDETR